MINTTKKLIILASSSQLYVLVRQAIELITRLYASADKAFRTALSKIDVLYRKEESSEFTETLTYWYVFLKHKHGLDHHAIKNRKKRYFYLLTKSDITYAKVILRLIFVYLHKHKAVILTYDFSRPRGSVSSAPEIQKEFYTETIWPFLELEQIAPNIRGTGKRTYTANQRLWQTGIKVLLMSSCFTPEDITPEDMQKMRTAQLKDSEDKFIPLPIPKICETICQAFPTRVSIKLNAWMEFAILRGNTAAVEFSNFQELLLDILSKTDNPLQVALGIVRYRRYGVSSFACDTIAEYRLDAHVHQGWELFKEAMDNWLNAENAYFRHQTPEKIKSRRMAIGKINIYLFIYLPLWIFQNPLSKFKYPSTPAKFTSSVHYNCDAPASPDRPLSLCELCQELGYKESNATQAEIRSFFNYLISFGSELAGCADLKQPVRQIPKSKKYTYVTKNVFTGEQLRQFIFYHYALNSAADYYIENSNYIHEVVEKARRFNSYVDTVDLGFVPVMYHEGKISYIRKLHPDSFHFVFHDYSAYYNPGCVRFGLFLLECGTRGQTLQWLDAESYDRISQRLSRESLQLTTIWVNTDKIRKTPFIIISTMANLWLLDDQRAWRNFMTEKVGVLGFNKKVFYDNDPNSQWGLILPLFSADPETGAPFTDSQYTKLWNYHCLNFQIWFKENTCEANPIVGFLPLKKGPTQTHFSWEDWINKIHPDSVKVIEGSPNNKVYQGDYCPISLRAYATPHAARASFITDMSINLPPEAVSLLTGQNLSTIIRYNKGHQLMKDRLQGAFNNRDASWFLTNLFPSDFSMTEARNMIDSAESGALPKVIDKLGLTSFATSPSPREMTGLKLIATDRSLSLGACYTHICPYNFICPESIIVKFGGQKKCSQCPYAVFSTHNLPAIEAHRQKVAEDYLSMVKVIESYNQSNEVSTAEKNRLQEEVKACAKDIIHWMQVEEILWAKIVMQQAENESAPTKDFIVLDSNTVTNETSRKEYKRDSVEGFLSRLDSACTYPESMSREFEYKIDRATRLLMISDGNTLGAALMPSSFPSAVKLVGMLRSSLSFDKIDIEDFVRLLNLDDKGWEQALLSYKPTKPTTDGSS